MAVSGSIDFTLTRDTCIAQALAQLGVLGEGEVPTAAQYTDDAITLNLMLKAWQNKEISQNLIRRVYVWMQDEKTEYSLSTTAASSDESSADFYFDKLDAALSASGTTLSVTTGTGIADSDRIGIELSNGKMHWTTVASGGATTAPVLTTGPATAAASGNAVYAYTTKATRPLDILYGVEVAKSTVVGENTVVDGTSIPLEILARERYVDLANKKAESTQVNSLWYDEQWPTGLLHVWPEPTGHGRYLTLWVQTTIDDMDAAGDNFALPSKWYLAIAFQLALWLTPKYGVSDAKFKRIQLLAAEALFLAETGESEDYLRFTPDDRGRT